MNQKTFYDLTQEPEKDALLAIDERVSYVVDLLEHALKLEYLRRL